MDAPARERVALRGRDEIDRIREAGLVVHQVLAELAAAAVPGTTTGELDRIARERTREAGARPAFLGYRGFPACVCISINDEVIHGIPSPRRALRDGDLVGLDFGVVLDGWFADAARTVAVGKASPEALRLQEVARAALAKGAAAARPGAHVGDLGAAIEGCAREAGFSVVREFVGHGIGRRLHEAPQVPNYGPGGVGLELEEGMVLAVEPMVNAGGAEVRTLDDGWTAVTADGRLSAHFEHTLAVTRDGPEVLTLPPGVRLDLDQ